MQADTAVAGHLRELQRDGSTGVTPSKSAAQLTNVLEDVFTV
jgi:hypothetical protein